MTSSDSLEKILERHKDTLANADDRLLAELERRLYAPNNLVAKAASWLPSAAACQRWAWRLLLLYLMFHGIKAAVYWRYDEQIRDFMQSDTMIELELQYQYFVRRVSVLFGLYKFETTQRAAQGLCILQNPLYKEALMCCKCKFSISAAKVSDIEKVQDNFDSILEHGKPRVFTIINHPQQPQPYPVIRRKVMDNLADMELGYNKFRSLSGPSVSSLSALFASEDQPPEKSVVMWHFSHVEAIRHMRPLTARPEFIGRHVEINLGRYFLFIGRQHPVDSPVDIGMMDEYNNQMFLSAVYSQMRVTVMSNPKCCTKAKNKVRHSVLLNPGKILSLPSGCFRVTVQRTNSSEYAIAYLGSVPHPNPPAKERAKLDR